MYSILFNENNALNVQDICPRMRFKKIYVLKLVLYYVLKLQSPPTNSL
jgi:hypothetical protein